MLAKFPLSLTKPPSEASRCRHTNQYVRRTVCVHIDMKRAIANPEKGAENTEGRLMAGGTFHILVGAGWSHVCPSSALAFGSSQHLWQIIVF